MKNIEIAPLLGLKPTTLNTMIWKATKQGWLKFDNPAERLEQELSHVVVDNIEHHLSKKDKQMTIEAAKGLGLFKSHQAVKVESDAPQTVLALKIESTGESQPSVVGNVVGRPKTFERSAADDATILDTEIVDNAV